MRASVRASASTAALEPRGRKNQAQSFAISKNMSTQWRKVDGRWGIPGEITASLARFVNLDFQKCGESSGQLK